MGSDEAREKRPIQKWAVIGTVLFFIVAYPLSIPCMCLAGSVKADYNMILLLIVTLRLLIGILTRKLTVGSFLIWVLGFFAFNIYAELL